MTRHLAIADAVDAVKLGSRHGGLSACKILAEILAANLGKMHAWEVHIHGGKLEEHVVGQLIEEHAPAAKPKQSKTSFIDEGVLSDSLDMHDNNSFSCIGARIMSCWSCYLKTMVFPDLSFQSTHVLCPCESTHVFRCELPSSSVLFTHLLCHIQNLILKGVCNCAVEARTMHVRCWQFEKAKEKNDHAYSKLCERFHETWATPRKLLQKKIGMRCTMESVIRLWYGGAERYNSKAVVEGTFFWCLKKWGGEQQNLWVWWSSYYTVKQTCQNSNRNGSTHLLFGEFLAKINQGEKPWVGLQNFCG